MEAHLSLQRQAAQHCPLTKSGPVYAGPDFFISSLDKTPVSEYDCTVRTLPPRGVYAKETEVADMMADPKTVTRLLKTARGQLDGILKMVEENRYCIDISQQIMATEAILNRANKEILAAHLKHCVQEASSDEERAAKIDEFTQTLGRILK